MKTFRATVFLPVLCAAAVASAADFGDGELCAIQDRKQLMPPTLFGEKSSEPFEASCNVFLLTRGEKIILVDTGNGAARGGEALAKIAAEKVTDILITHTHGDHVGGLFGTDGKATFPGATIHVHKLGAKQLADCVERLRTFDWDEEVLPGIIARDFHGHTPEHTAFELEHMIFGGDFIHALALQIAKPEVCARFDAEPSAAIVARKKLLDHAADSGKIVLGAHLPFPGAVKIKKSAAGNYSAEPALAAENP